MRTFVYRYVDVTTGGTLGWFPTDTSNVSFEYTALGELTPTDVDNNEEIETTTVRFSVQNPMDGGGNLVLSLRKEQRVSVRVFDIAGRLVTTLHDGRLGAGRHVLHWDGRDRNDLQVARGVYLAQLKTENDRQRLGRKLVILR